MISIPSISKEARFMEKLRNGVRQLKTSAWFVKVTDVMNRVLTAKGERRKTRVIHPFWVIVKKEVSDHVRSWRFIVLLFLILLTCFGSLYTSITNLVDEVAKSSSADDPFFFLKLFTLSDGSLPPFHVFIGFIGPLLGIGLGFDAINSEQNSGTLSRVMAQPIHRDYLINAKFTAALIVISVMFFALGLLVMGFGMLIIGIPPTAGEFIRIIFFLLLSVLYVAFWLNLSVFLSIRFKQGATSALTAIAIWLFFTVFYQIIVNLVARAMAPAEMASPQQLVGYQQFILNLMRVVPSQLYADATTTLLVPSVRSLGPLTMQQTYGAIPSPLPLGQSLLIVWPQLTGLIAATVVCFGLSYMSFMRKEIRSR